MSLYLITEVGVKSNDNLVCKSVELMVKHIQWFTDFVSRFRTVGLLGTLTAKSALTVPWNIGWCSSMWTAPSKVWLDTVNWS